MPRTTWAASLIAALVLSAAGGVRLQTTPSAPSTQAGQSDQDESTQQPVFRTGIDFVRVDVIVTDDQGDPVVDLDQDDFEVYEDGAAQTIESFKLIQIGSVPGPDAEFTAPIRTRYDEEREAAREDVRLFVILFDDYHVRRVSAMAVKAPLIRFLTQQLSPLDMVAFMYPLTPTGLVSFSRDRGAAVSAVEAFEGRKYDYEPRNQFEEQYAFYPTAVVERVRNEVSLSALRSLVTWLGTVREGRKSVILVSEGYTYNLPPTLNSPVAAIPSFASPLGAAQDVGDTERFFNEMEMGEALRWVADAANRSNTAIYTLDPRGLAASEFDISEGVSLRTDIDALTETVNTLRVLADDTDGRAIINSNDLDAGLRQAVRDASVYYLIGYSSTAAPADGKFHEIKVRIKRPGVQVRARKGYWALSAEDLERATVPPEPGPPQDVAEALAPLAAAPRGRLVRTWIGTARGEEDGTRVTFVWEPVPLRSGAERTLGMPARAKLTAASPNGDLYFLGTVEPSDTSAAQSGRQSAMVTFETRPGPLQIKASFETADGRPLDSDRQTIDVPDFTESDVGLSTPRVFRAVTPRDLRVLRDDPEAIPTGHREFSRRERLLLRFEAYGRGGTAPAVAARILNREGEAMTDLVVEPPAGPQAPYQVEVPLAHLPPGEFLVEIAASGAEGSPIRRLVGIRVTS
jgi:VWFA-related protein